MNSPTTSHPRTSGVTPFFGDTNSNDRQPVLGATTVMKDLNVKEKNLHFVVRMYSHRDEQSKCTRRCLVGSTLALTLLSLAACSGFPSQATAPIAVAPHVQLTAGDSEALNYSTDLIYSFEFKAPGGISGGASLVGQVKPNGRPANGGKTCCTSVPVEWQPDLKLTARWLAYQMRDGKVVKNWYKAENVKIPRYDGTKAGTTWVVFLPSERIRIMVPDGIDPDGGNNPDIRPPDSDPYIAQGVLDEEWNRLYLGREGR
jgi:hypothetical protein